MQATVAVVLLRIVQRDAGLLAEDLDQVLVILREHAAAKLRTTFRVTGAWHVSRRHALARMRVCSQQPCELTHGGGCQPDSLSCASLA